MDVGSGVVGLGTVHSMLRVKVTLSNPIGLGTCQNPRTGPIVAVDAVDAWLIAIAQGAWATSGLSTCEEVSSPFIEATVSVNGPVSRIVHSADLRATSVQSQASLGHNRGYKFRPYLKSTIRDLRAV